MPIGSSNSSTLFSLFNFTLLTFRDLPMGPNLAEVLTSKSAISYQTPSWFSQNPQIFLRTAVFPRIEGLSANSESGFGFER